MVEDVFRSMKSLLDTRRIFHKCDETIRGHVFCSFLALLLRKQLQDRLASKDCRTLHPGLHKPAASGLLREHPAAHFKRPGTPATTARDAAAGAVLFDALAAE
jgi:hypothetical protein